MKILGYQSLPIRIIYLVTLASGITVFQVLSLYANHLSVGYDFEFSWGFIFLKHSINNLLWLMVLPVVFTISQPIAKVNSAGLQQWSTFLLWSVFIAFMHKVVSIRAYDFVFSLESGYLKDFLGANNVSQITTGFFSGLIEIWILTALLLAVDYQKKLANKERDLVTAKLDALRMQLHPHFLFNTLHSIASMIDIDVKKAQKMITQVGDLLRKMLEHQESEIVSVEQELKFIRDYLELEQIRFQDRMTLLFEIQDDVLEAKVPHMILQPLVENCIKHGVSKSTGESQVVVKFYQYQNGSAHRLLKMEIDNIDEDVVDYNNQPTFGIGQRNVKSRLEEIYGDNFDFHFDRLNANHFKSTVTIPFET